jgi:hypothetical protein
VTAAGLQKPEPRAEAPRSRGLLGHPGLRLVRLHLASRRVPGALAALALCALVLRAALIWHWSLGNGNGAQQLPVLIEAGAASIIAVTAQSPFGDPERATGRWLPYLRLGTAVGLTMAAVAALALCGLVMRAALYWHWSLGSGPGAQELAVVLEAGAASVIAVTAQSPFGDPERATGRWLPYLRLGTAVGLSAAAFGALCAGAAAEQLPGGNLDILRNTAGMTGIGLLLAAVIGGALAWVGPMAYMIVTLFAVSWGWTTPWLWAARPSHDLGGALCAGLIFAAGLVVATVRGSRAPREI